MADTIWTYNGRIPTLGGGNRIPYFISGYTPTDSDAIAFISAAGITDDTQKEAIDDLVIGLKADSLWTKMYAIYPIVGGTADTHKYNLKDPRDLDAAYRVTWGGGITHSSTGIQGDGSTGYGDTHFADNVWANDNRHMSFYSRTNTFGGQVDIGQFNGNTNALGQMMVRYSVSNDCYMRFSNAGANIGTVTDSRGFFSGSKFAAGGTNVTGYKNGSSIGSMSQTSTTLSTLSYYLMAQNNSGVVNSASTREYCFFSFGQSLDATDSANLNTRVQAFQTALGRNV